MNLENKAILVSLQRHIWTGTRLSKTATGIVEADTGKTSVGQYNKKLLSKCPEYTACKKAFTEVYEFVRNNTLPWMDDGVRLLPTKSFIEFKQDYEELRDKCEQKVTALQNVWDAAVLEDSYTLGKLFNPADYPPACQVDEYWGLRLTVRPVPTSGDFRVEVSDEDKAALDAEVQRQEEESRKHLLNMILEPLRAMVSKLNVPIGSEGAVFRNSLVGNVTDMVERARKLNVDDDQNINDQLDAIEKIMANVTADALRTSPEVRSATAKKADAVAKKMAAWF